MKAALQGKYSFRFFSAKCIRAEMLASVYPAAERMKQLDRYKSFSNDSSAELRFFAIAKQEKRTVAFLHLCREKKRFTHFRIRGLYTHRDFRNQSLATRLLRFGCKCVSEFYNAEAVFSFILPTNIPSCLAHEYAGFFLYNSEKVHSERHRVLVWRKNTTILERNPFIQ